MFNEFFSTPHHAHSNSLEIAIRAREQEQKMSLMVAGYRKASRSQSPAGRRSIKQLLSALLTSLR